jgi:hypothetical protein
MTSTNSSNVVASRDNFAHNVFAAFKKAGVAEGASFRVIADRLTTFDLATEEGRAAHKRDYDVAKFSAIAGRLVASGICKTEAEAFSRAKVSKDKDVKSAAVWFYRQAAAHGITSTDARGGASNGKAGGNAKAKAKGTRAPHHNAPTTEAAPPASVKAVLPPRAKDVSDVVVFIRDVAALCARTEAANAKALIGDSGAAARQFFAAIRAASKALENALVKDDQAAAAAKAKAKATAKEKAAA